MLRLFKIHKFPAIEFSKLHHFGVLGRLRSGFTSEPKLEKCFVMTALLSPAFLLEATENEVCERAREVAELKQTHISSVLLLFFWSKCLMNVLSNQINNTWGEATPLFVRWQKIQAKSKPLSQHSCVFSGDSVRVCVHVYAWWSCGLCVFIVFHPSPSVCVVYVSVFLSCVYLPAVSHSLLSSLFFHPVFSLFVFICVCVLPEEELSGYSCLRRCPYGGIVDNKSWHQPAVLKNQTNKKLCKWISWLWRIYRLFFTSLVTWLWKTYVCLWVVSQYLDVEVAFRTSSCWGNWHI